MSEDILVVKPSLPPYEEYIEEIKDIWDTGIMTHTGPKHVELQAKLEKYLEVDHVELFANGHLAMELGLNAFGFKPGSEVITTPFTFASTTQAILRNGLVPVFCDIREDDFTIDVDKIEELINYRTVAILPVHVYGNICDVKKIQEIADKHGLKVLYDGAHAFAEKYDGVNVSNFGDMTMFSFHATKVFNTVEGGCLTFKDESYKQKLIGLRQFGQIIDTDSVPYIGTNAKLTEIHAAMGLCNLRHVDEYLEKRKEVVNCYRKMLSDTKGIRLSIIQENVSANYAYFPIVVEEAETGVTREMVEQALLKEGIFSRRYFYPLTCDFECCAASRVHIDVPVARHASERVLALPCYSDLKVSDVERICNVILNTVKKNG